MTDIVIDFANPERKRRLFEVLKNLKKVKYTIIIKQFRDKRSNNQNRYYRGVIVKMLAEYCGCYPDEMHEILKKKFRPKDVVIKGTGDVFTVGRSTTEDNTFEAEQYYEQIRIWALQELDFLIPLPNETEF